MAFMASNFAIQLTLSASLNMIWSIMNALQIIVYMPLLHLSMPQNAYVTAVVFLQLANFDIFPSQWLYQASFKFKSESIGFGSRFQNLGFDNKNFLLNSGSILWFYCIWAVLSCVYLLLKKVIKHKKAQEFLKSLQFTFFYGILIRLALEMFVELLMSTLIQLYGLKWKASGDAFGSFMALILTPALLLLFPVLIYAIVLKIRRNNPQVQEFSSGLKRNPQANKQNFYFILRRILFVCSLVLLRDFLVAQLAILMISSYALVCYYILCQPFVDAMLNRLELFNEACILAISYLMFIFTDYQEHPDLKFASGWLFCFAILFTLLVNIFALLVQSVLPLIYKCRGKKYKKQLETEKKKRRQTESRIEVNYTQEPMVTLNQTALEQIEPNSLFNLRKKRRKTVTNSKVHKKKTHKRKTVSGKAITHDLQKIQEEEEVIDDAPIQAWAINQNGLRSQF